MKECCANCNNRKTLTWWSYKRDGKLDQEHRGSCCTLFIDEGVIHKIDYPDVELCECFTPKAV